MRNQSYLTMIVLCLALYGCQNSDTENWVNLGTTDALEPTDSDLFETPEGTLQLDTQSIVQSREGTWLAWLRFSYDSEGTLPDGTKFSQVVSRIELDCTELRIRGVDEALYYDSAGEAIDHEGRSASTWSALTPTPTGERIRNLVCDEGDGY